jgi:uncharacterized membrane protein YeaQ/YmgE (transglycosylase-associated protein family)
MGLLWTVIIGFFVGLIARAVMPGRQIMGIILTTLLGIAGSLLAGCAGQLLGYYKLGDPVGFIASVIGAFVILFLWTKLVNK